MEPLRPSLPDRPVVLFDGVCNLCNAAVRFILDHDRRGRLLLCAAQSPTGRALLARFGKDGADPDTIYLLDGQRLYERSAAALRIARHMGPPWSLAVAFLVVPRFVRDGIYRWVARNRYRWFGKRDTCRLPAPGEVERFLA